MANFERVCQAIKYIDDRLDQKMDLESVSRAFHFSPYYFHRMFTLIVGKPMAAHIRDRRMEKAGRLLVETTDSLMAISSDCGFDSYPAFSRAFSSKYGMSPRDFRKLGRTPVSVSAEEMIAALKRRLKGGVLMIPKIMGRGSMLIAGTFGDGSATAEIWHRFMTLNETIGLPNRLTDNGYEVRIYEGGKSDCHVGLPVSDEGVDAAFSVFRLPASKYASFEVFVAKGYESGNAAMDEWLDANKATYRQRMLGGKPYVVEYYDERFKGNETDSIVEIWIPIEEV